MQKGTGVVQPESSSEARSWGRRDQEQASQSSHAVSSQTKSANKFRELDQDSLW